MKPGTFDPLQVSVYQKKTHQRRLAGLRRNSLGLSAQESISEDDLASELNDTSWAGGNDRAIYRTIIGIVIDRCANTSTREGIVTVLVVIEYIEEFCAELECDSFSELEILANSHVPVVNTGSLNDVPSAVAKLSGERLNEGGCIEPLRDAVLAAGWTNLVAALRKAEEQSEIVVAQYRERESFLERSNCRNLPATKRKIGSLVHVIAVALAASDRQLIYGTCHEAMVNVEVRKPVVPPWIVFVHMPGKGVG